jgi:hypothetical protein
MRIINPQWNNLSKGYQTALALEKQARQNWQTKWAKSVDFARQQGIKRAANLIQSQVQSEKRTLRIVLVLLAAILVSMTILSALAESNPQLNWLLLPVGVINTLQALILLLPILEKLKAIAELNKTQAQAESLNPSLDLTEQWWQFVSGYETPANMANAEDGQLAFIKYLAQNLPNDYFAIHSPLIQNSLHIDVLLLGPTGIWLFEINHWSGKITCHDGIQRFTNAPGQPASGLENPGKLWQTGRNLIEKTLSLRLARNANFGLLLHGGLVFTHPSVQIETSPNSPIECGTPSHWLQRIRATPKVSKFSTELQLIVLDILLDYALSTYVAKPLLSSSIELAKALYGDTLDHLRDYILRQVRRHLPQKGAQ